MWLVCAAGAGDISTGVTNILATVTAFSPVIGIFAYRIYRATAISSYAQKENWVWWTGGLLAAYTGVIYLIIGLLAYGFVGYSEAIANYILYIALFGIPVFWAWFGTRVLKVQKRMKRIEVATLSLLGCIPYIVTIILFSYIAFAPQYLIAAQENVHTLNVLYGLLLPAILAVSCMNLFVFYVQYMQRKKAKSLA